MAWGFVRSALVSVAAAGLYLAAVPAQASSSSWNTTNTFNPTSSSPTQPSTCPTGSSTGTSSGPSGTGTKFCVTTLANNPNANNLQNQGLTSTSGGVPQVVYGNQYTFTTSAGSVLQAGAFYLASNAGTSTFQLANLEAYTPGLGVTSKTTSISTEQVGNTPGHTMDNQGVIDAILFKFPTSNYDVTSLTLSQFGTTNNFNYFIGSASALSSIGGLAGIQLQNLTVANGWTAGGQVTGANGTPTTINAAGKTGEYLLVMAALNGTTDDIKIAGVGGQTKVPEPSTLAMFGTAGLIALRLRRRKQAKS